MKRILYISSCDPEYSNGGAIGTAKIIKTLDMMKNKNVIEWYGIVNKEKDFKVKLGKYAVEIFRTKKNAYISRILGYAEQMELNIPIILKLIKEKNIDIVILQNSRLGNIAEKIKKEYPLIKIIQNFDNFEYKFAKMFTKNKNFIIKLIERFNVKNSEKKAIKNMDIGIFLTELDKNEVESFYNINLQNTKIIPFIYSNFFSKDKAFDKKNQIIFTGSLDMESNIEGALFLIENYTNFFKEHNITLVLAGRNPDSRVLDKIFYLGLNEKIKVVSNPTREKMEELLRESLVYVSPVFDGSGMKTKFVEALFYGLPIIATEHTLIGYNESFASEQFIQIFLGKDDFKEKFEILLKEIQDIDINNKIRDFYQKNFSEETILKELEVIINEI